LAGHVAKPGTHDHDALSPAASGSSLLGALAQALTPSNMNGM
jgi:hypothetical protein